MFFCGRLESVRMYDFRQSDRPSSVVPTVAELPPGAVGTQDGPWADFPEIVGTRRPVDTPMPFELKGIRSVSIPYLSIYTCLLRQSL